MKVLILGVDYYSRGDIWSGQSCFEFITNSIFQSMEGIDFYFIELYDLTGLNPDFSKIQPGTNLILYINWDVPIDFEYVKKMSGAKLVFSLLEVPVKNVDWCFYFCNFPPGSECENGTKIVAPYNSRIYERVPKKKKIVIDHHTGTLKNYRWDLEDGVIDMTFEISDWVSELRNEYEIIRMTRFPEIDKGNIKPWEKELFHCNLKTFLNETNDVDVFIQTHTDGFGYGIIDMAVRGTRIFSPPHFLCEELVKPLGIKLFENKNDLLNLIRSDRESYWSENYKNCTSFDEIVKLIIKKYETWNSDLAI